MEHYDEELELYALGMLEPDERDRVDEHARTCDSCAERLGRAENAVAALALGSQRRSAPRWPAWPAAIAAAFALTSGVLFSQNLALRGAVSSDGRVLDALVLSHFVHVPFVATSATPAAAKVIYEQHGRWYQIVAERSADWQVAVTTTDGAVHRIAERPQARGTASYLTLSIVGPVRTIELDDANGVAFARANPVVAADRQ